MSINEHHIVLEAFQAIDAVIKDLDTGSHGKGGSGGIFAHDARAYDDHFVGGIR